MSFVKNYSLSIILAILFLLSWVGQAYFQWEEFVSVQHAHHISVSIRDFTNEFLSATFENWQSEFLQLFSFVVLATYFIHKNSPQSRDSSDKMQKMLIDIQKNIKKINSSRE